jgi:hypothetical protein
MARKRGGLAGFYDRRKGLIRTASTIGASLLGGPAAGAAVGAAFRGFDRPGQSGIGFDVGQGLRGAAEGYTTGKLTQAGQAGLSKLFAPKAAMPELGSSLGGALPADLPMSGAPSIGMTPTSAGPMNIGVPRMGAPVNLPLSGAPSVGMTPSAAGPMNIGVPRMRAPVDLPLSGAPSVGMTPSAAGPMQMSIGAPRMAAQDIGSLLKPAQRETGRGFGRAVADFTKGLESRSKTIEGITKGIQMAMPSPGSEAAMMNAETQRQQLEMQRQQMQEEQRRRETIAALLMPMYQQMMQSRGVMPPNSITQRYG